MATMERARLAVAGCCHGKFTISEYRCGWGRRARHEEAQRGRQADRRTGRQADRQTSRRGKERMRWSVRGVFQKERQGISIAGPRSE